MCVLKTPEALIGITNNHVLKIYEKHKAERHDIFCQLGGAPFDPTAFRIPALTLRHWGHRVFERDAFSRERDPAHRADPALPRDASSARRAVTVRVARLGAAQLQCV